MSSKGKKPRVSIIIPTKDEEEGIAKVICKIPEEVLKDGEVIIVDNSKDSTPLIAERLGAKVIRVRKQGKGYAMRVGVRNSRGEILVFLDGDGTDPPEYIPKLLRKLESGKCDIVIGARSFSSPSPKLKEKVVFDAYAPFVIGLFKVLGMKMKGGYDPLGGFRAMRRETWDQLSLQSDDFLIETEMNLKAIQKGLKMCFVKIPLLPRAGGMLKSKFVKSFDQWAKILAYCLSFVKDEKIKEKIWMLMKGKSVLS